MEQFKNLMQVMIWAHNRLDTEALRYMQLEINNSLKMGLITSNQLMLLNQARTLYENDCYEQMRKKQEEAVNASMA